MTAERRKSSTPSEGIVKELERINLLLSEYPASRDIYKSALNCREDVVSKESRFSPTNDKGKSSTLVHTKDASKSEILQKRTPFSTNVASKSEILHKAASDVPPSPFCSDAQSDRQPIGQSDRQPIGCRFQNAAKPKIVENFDARSEKQPVEGGFRCVANYNSADSGGFKDAPRNSKRTVLEATITLLSDSKDIVLSRRNEPDKVEVARVERCRERWRADSGYPPKSSFKSKAGKPSCTSSEPERRVRFDGGGNVRVADSEGTRRTVSSMMGKMVKAMAKSILGKVSRITNARKIVGLKKLK